MPKVDITKTHSQLQESIIARTEIIEETIPRLTVLLKKMPLSWLTAIDLNYAEFLDYLNTVVGKFAKEILAIKK